MTARVWAGRLLAASAIVVSGTTAASAEPFFLSKQYTRCAQCHYSQSGGGLLTPYGRSLTQELSTTGRPSQPDEQSETPQGEEAFLWGTAKGSPKGLDFGIELRPAHLSYSSAGFTASRNIWMNADGIAAYRTGGWTLYGEMGREPTSPRPKVGSYEHWVGYQNAEGIGVRAGRFLPAYGVYLADHTSLGRATLGLAQYDQVYGVEVSKTTDHTLLQASIGPGRAQSYIDDDGHQAFTATGRWQFDLGTRGVVVASGLFRNASQLDARTGAGGVAFGFSPAPRVSIWTQADLQHRDGSDTNTYVIVNETAFEAIPGIWLKVSPQMRTDDVTGLSGLRRLVLSADLLPRTHWNLNLSYYRDRITSSAVTSTIFLTQLHMYL